MKFSGLRTALSCVHFVNGLAGRVALAALLSLVLSSCESPEQYAARMDAQQQYQGQPQQRRPQPQPYGGQGGGYGYEGRVPSYPRQEGPWNDADDYGNGGYQGAPGYGQYPGGGYDY